MDDRVLWYPGYDDKFVTLGRGQDIKLYKVVRVSQVNLMVSFFALLLTGTMMHCSDMFRTLLIWSFLYQSSISIPTTVVLCWSTQQKTSDWLQLVNFTSMLQLVNDISSSCDQRVKIRLVANCHLKTCYNLLKWLAASLLITSWTIKLHKSVDRMQQTGWQQAGASHANASWYRLVTSCCKMSTDLLQLACFWLCISQAEEYYIFTPEIFSSRKLCRLGNINWVNASQTRFDLTKGHMLSFHTR